MIHKSYNVEENLNILKNNIILFYGENLGLIQDFKNKIKEIFKKEIILTFNQDEIIKNQSSFLNEIKNKSLFHENKIFFINNADDKLLGIIESILPEITNEKVYLFASTLEKKSKLRNYFEKEKKLDVVPCYQDNELNIKKIILNNLKNFSGLSSTIVNMIMEHCNNDRAKLKNEIEKIKTYFIENKIKINELEKLLNLKVEENFNIIRDTVLVGNKKKTNILLTSTIIEMEKSGYYLSVLNQRLLKLRELTEKNNIEKAINEIKPPVFWKDKPSLILQAKIWNKNKLKEAFSKTYSVEVKIKSNTYAEKRILLKKLLVDMCNLANAA